MSDKSSNRLDDSLLDEVSGGTDDAGLDQRRLSFQAAWRTLDMEGKGFSGNQRAEFFEEWDASRTKSKKSAAEFLKDIK
ncbi:MAG: hypothetical protein K5696_02125 [Lachnospiraceae bacterium]|nr:hypothetical protein [Lachnospiraceae bacterium]